MEAFNGEDVNLLARIAFRIVFMNAKGKHFWDQSGAQTGGTEENMSVAVTYMVGCFF